MIHSDMEEDEDEEFSTSLSVGDGRYLVDLGRYADINILEDFEMLLCLSSSHPFNIHLLMID